MRRCDGRGKNLRVYGGTDIPTFGYLATGALIDYRLKLHGVPVRWRTRIEVWEPPMRFVDVQARGPYAHWEHAHTFECDGEHAVVISDCVRYALPFGPLGQIAHAAFVRRDLKRVFDYREHAVAERLLAGPART